MAFRGVKIDNENCTGCLHCQVRCSFHHTGRFNPLRSRIKIRRIDRKERFRISFSPECAECEVLTCVDACFYDALKGV
ncbi:MAG: 4Fe-4S dicluster domain-containing protein [Candidatus Geothermarchaeales archaeon]